LLILTKIFIGQSLVVALSRYVGAIPCGCPESLPFFKIRLILKSVVLSSRVGNVVAHHFDLQKIHEPIPLFVFELRNPIF
ncbi:MAG: hypothetical protein KAI83_19985, partial [Thiomargarita sp.]|nr:hypothetical protein [Thiomargarita sp.]